MTDGVSRAALRWGAPLAVGLAIAIVGARGATAEPASAAGLVGLAVALGLLVVAASIADRASRRVRTLAVAAALLAVGLAGSQALLEPGLPQGHDLKTHLWGLWSVWTTVLDGDWTPRWIPYLGTGVPLLGFYSPLGHLLAMPAQAVGAGPAAALAFALTAGQVLSAGSAYGSARWLGASRAGSLLASAAFVLAPYHLFNQTFRLAYGESLAMPLLPPLLASAWLLLTVAAPPRRAGLVLGASAAGLLLTHVPSVLVAGNALVLLALLAAAVRGPREVAWGRALAPLAVAVAVTVGWWAPFLLEWRHTGIGGLVSSTAAGYGDLGAGWLEPWVRQGWAERGVRLGWSEAAVPGRTCPVYFGALLTGCAAWAVVRPTRAGGPASWPWAALAVALIVLSTRTVGAWVEHLPGGDFPMFPWRHLAPASAAAALAVALGWDGVSAGMSGRVRGAALAVVVALLAWDAVPYLGAARRIEHLDLDGVRHSARQETQAFGAIEPRVMVRVEESALPPGDYRYRVGLARRGYAEYLPTALYAEYGQHWYLPAEDVATSSLVGVSWRFLPGVREPLRIEPQPFAVLLPDVPLSFERTPERIVLTLPPAHPGGTVRVAESWFVGWQVRVDGGPWRDPEPPGLLLAAPVPAGAREVEFAYRFLTPLHRPLSAAVSLGALVGLGLLWWRRRGSGSYRRLRANSRKQSGAGP